MTFSTLAWAHDSATHPAQALRQMVGALTMTPVISHVNAVSPTTRGGGYGVSGDGLAVTFTSGLGYSISAGAAVVTDTHALGHGAFTVSNDAAVAGTLAARDATNPRISLICVRVRNGDVDSSGGEDVGLVEIAGVAAASPVVPSLPSTLGSLLVRSEVLVPVSGNPTFTSRGQYVTAAGGRVRCTSTSRPTGAGLWTGQRIRESDTAHDLEWTSTEWAPNKLAARGVVQRAFKGTNEGGFSGAEFFITGLTVLGSPWSARHTTVRYGLVVPSVTAPGAESYVAVRLRQGSSGTGGTLIGANIHPWTPGYQAFGAGYFAVCGEFPANGLSAGQALCLTFANGAGSFTVGAGSYMISSDEGGS